MGTLGRLPGRVGRDVVSGLRRLGLLAAALALIAALAAAVSLPLWYLASRHARLYTAGVLGLAGLASALFLGRRLLRSVKSSGGPKGFLRTRVLPILKTAALAAASLAVLYAAAVLASRGRLAAALAAAGGWIFVLGLLRYGRKTAR